MRNELDSISSASFSDEAPDRRDSKSDERPFSNSRVATASMVLALFDSFRSSDSDDEGNRATTADSTTSIRCSTVASPIDERRHSTDLPLLEGKSPGKNSLPANISDDQEDIDAVERRGGSTDD